NRQTLNIGSSSTGNIVIGNSATGVSLNLGSDTTGDIYYRNASGTLSRLAIGASNTFLTGGTTPTWTAGYVNDATDATLTRSGSGPYTLGLNLGNANIWTALQTFNNGVTVGNNSTLTLNAGSALTVTDLANNSAVYTNGSHQLTTTAPTTGVLGFWQ